ncbi:MAG: site-specific DNA-methyltransferase [Gleimia sp.]
MTEELNEVPRTTPDFTTEAASQLAELFPEAIADGKINFDTLKTILDIDVENGRERFGLTWPGKREAIRAAQTATTATLMPDKENSVDWDTTQNVFIEGDNLEALKILQKHYYGQIKMIYIDPPYNTGNDFVYSDNYSDPIGSYLARTGQIDEGGNLSTNTESDGRFHSNWLNMMYPRLKLARNLLKNDGVIFISIDDNEQARLRALCDQVFGESNYVNTFAWVSNPKGRQISANGAAITKEYILCYARDRRFAPEFDVRISLVKPLMPETYKGFDYALKSDEIGPFVVKNELYNSNSKFNEETRPNLVFDIYYDPDSGKVRTADRSETHLYPGFVKISPKKNNNGSHKYHAFRWSREKIAEESSELYFREVGNDEWRVYTKVRSTDQTILKDTITGLTTTTGANDLENVGIPKAYFDHPKPVKLVQVLLEAAGVKSGDTVLDFFAGSATTANAVFVSNAETGDHRSCISIQLPELTDAQSDAHKAGYETISQLSRERIRRAGKKVLEGETGKLDGRAEDLDVGFRAYKLVDTNFTKWKADSGLSEAELVGLFSDLADSADDHVRPEALLTEVLLKLGFSLTEKIETVEVAGLSVFSVADGLVMAYLDEHTQPTLDQLRALVAREPERLVILEDAFQGNDELKTNLVQECRTRNVDLWTA